jgi:nucleoid-associated protein YgaU
MATRYDGLSQKTTSKQNSETMSEVLDNRGLNQITHYNTSKLQYPTVQQIRTLTIDAHTWSHQDRYWKLAAKYYGDSKYWWVIAWFNKKPIESMLNIGDQVSIPMPLDRILRML